MNARKVRAGLDAALAQLRARGREAELVLTTSEQAAAGEGGQPRLRGRPMIVSSSALVSESFRG